MLGLLFCTWGDLAGQVIDPAEWRKLHAGNPSVAILEQEVNWLIDDTTNHQLAKHELLVKLVKRQVGKPYVAGSLDRVNVNLKPIFCWHEVDCYTLVENCVALINAYQHEIQDSDSLGDHDFSVPVNERICQKFFRELTSIRYRGGRYNGYNTRLHFARDLIADNARNGWHIPQVSVKWDTLVKDIRIAEKVIGIAKTDKLMLKQTQDSLSRVPFAYIPTTQADSALSQLPEGTLLFFLANRQKPIDISHVGVLVKEKDVTKLLHASSVKKQVVLTRESVVTYMKQAGCLGFVPVWTWSD